MKSKNERRYSFWMNLVMTLLSVIMVFPFLLLIAASFTDNEAVLRYGYSLIPRKFSLMAYQYIWTERVQTSGHIL